MTSFDLLSKYIYLYFNSHAHVERDITWIAENDIRRISTHTLTWSVTGRITRRTM